MTKFMGGLMLGAFVFSLQSCSVESGGSGSGNGSLGGGTGNQYSHSDSYEFSLNGCSTGKHSFSSNSAAETNRQLCTALMDEQLNKYCANSMRKTLYNQKCASGDAKPADPQKPGTPNTACITFVGGNYASTDERIQAANACQGVTNVDAVRFVAGTYPSFNERVSAAIACRGNINYSCTEFVAGNYPSFDERIQAANVCHDVEFSCVNQVAGNYPSFQERVKAAKACGGH